MATSLRRKHFIVQTISQLLIKEQGVQECDARKDDSSDTDGYKIKSTPFKIL